MSKLTQKIRADRAHTRMTMFRLLLMATSLLLVLGIFLGLKAGFIDRSPAAPTGSPAVGLVPSAHAGVGAQVVATPDPETKSPADPPETRPDTAAKAGETQPPPPFEAGEKEVDAYNDLLFKAWQSGQLPPPGAPKPEIKPLNPSRLQLLTRPQDFRGRAIKVTGVLSSVSTLALAADPSHFIRPGEVYQCTVKPPDDPPFLVLVFRDPIVDNAARLNTPVRTDGYFFKVWSPPGREGTYLPVVCAWSLAPETLEEQLFNDVVDGAALTPKESGAYNYLAAKAWELRKGLPAGEVPTVTRDELTADPDRYRGRLVRVSGALVSSPYLKLDPDPENPGRPRDSWQCGIKSATQNPVVVIVFRNPLGDNSPIRAMDAVTVDAWFLKVWEDRNPEGQLIRWPLLMGYQLTKIERGNNLMPFVATLVGGLALAIIVLFFWLRRGQRQAEEIRRRLAARSAQEETPEPAEPGDAGGDQPKPG